MKKNNIAILLAFTTIFGINAVMASDFDGGRSHLKSFTFRSEVKEHSKKSPESVNKEEAGNKENLAAGEIKENKMPIQAQATAEAVVKSENKAEIKELLEKIKSGNKIDVITLNNGVKIIYKKNTSADIVTVKMVSKIGSAYETAGNNGISTLLFEMLKKGNAKLNAEQIAAGIEKTGAIFDTEVSKLEGTITLTTTLKTFEQNFDIFADCVNTSTFPEEELNKEKQFLTAAIKASNDKMDEVCSKLFYRTMFENHPYAFHQYGTEESINKLKREDIIKWYKEMLVPANMTFVVVGNIEADVIKKAVEKRFGSLPKNDKQPAVIGEVDGKIKAGAKPFTALKEVKELKDKAQCFIYMGFLTPGVDSADYGSLKILSTVLGGGMSSRLFSILRDKESLSYQITAYYQTLKGNSALIMLMGTQPEKYEQAIASLKREAKRLSTELITEEEYNRAKNKIVGTYALSRNTMSQQAQFLGTWDALGLGADFENQFLEKTLAPTREDIRKTAEKYIDIDKAVIAVIYPSGKVEVKTGAKKQEKK